MKKSFEQLFVLKTRYRFVMLQCVGERECNACVAAGEFRDPIHIKLRHRRKAACNQLRNKLHGRRLKAKDFRSLRFVLLHVIFDGDRAYQAVGRRQTSVMRR